MVPQNVKGVGDHFIAGLNSSGYQSRMQAVSAGVDGYGVLGLNRFGELPFEFAGCRAGGQPA